MTITTVAISNRDLPRNGFLCFLTSNNPVRCFHPAWNFSYKNQNNHASFLQSHDQTFEYLPHEEGPGGEGVGDGGGGGGGVGDDPQALGASK